MARRKKGLSGSDAEHATEFVNARATAIDSVNDAGLALAQDSCHGAQVHLDTAHYASGMMNAHAQEGSELSEAARIQRLLDNATTSVRLKCLRSAPITPKQEQVLAVFQQNALQGLAGRAGEFTRPYRVEQQVRENRWGSPTAYYVVFDAQGVEVDTFANYRDAYNFAYPTGLGGLSAPRAENWDEYLELSAQKAAAGRDEDVTEIEDELEALQVVEALSPTGFRPASRTELEAFRAQIDAAAQAKKAAVDSLKAKAKAGSNAARKRIASSKNAELIDRELEKLRIEEGFETPMFVSSKRFVRRKGGVLQGVGLSGPFRR